MSLKEVWPVEPELLFCVHSLGFHHLKKMLCFYEQCILAF